MAVVGDFKCGKTYLAAAFADRIDEFSPEYFPLVLSESVRSFNFGLTKVTKTSDEVFFLKIVQLMCFRKVNLTIRDTGENAKYKIYRQHCFRKADVILMCFAIDSPESLENVVQKWMPEAS
jgi:GTPase SAR1 family protein